jgi:hypothetical protein
MVSLLYPSSIRLTTMNSINYAVEGTFARCEHGNNYPLILFFLFNILNYLRPFWSNRFLT